MLRIGRPQHPAERFDAYLKAVPKGFEEGKSTIKFGLQYMGLFFLEREQMAENEVGSFQ